MQEDLAKLLNDPHFNNPLAQSKLVQGGITQLVLHQEGQVLLLKINTKGELVSNKSYSVKTEAKVLQNYDGDVIQVLLDEDGDKF